MYVSPRPTDSLKSLPTQKFLFEFPIEVFFYFRNFRSVSVIVISVSAFYYNRKLLLIRLQEWFCKHVFRLLLVEMMASYEKRPRIDIKKNHCLLKCCCKMWNAFFKSSTKKTNRQKDDGVRKLKEGQYIISKKKTFLPTYRPCF